MGCASSRFDHSGLPFLVKARPAFLQRRLDDIKTRRNSPTSLADTTFSKKELLLHDKEDEDNMHASGHSRKSTFSPEEENERCVTSEGSENIIKEFSEKEGDLAAGNDTVKIIDSKHDSPDKKGTKVIQSEHKSSKGSKWIEDSTTCDSEIDEEDYLDERMLRRKDQDLGFPGSPSFRVYFDHNLEDNSDKAPEDYPQDIAKVDDPPSQEVESVVPQEKKQKRRRSFKKVLPRGSQVAMKNLLNVRSCMSSSHDSTHDQTHLLTPKTPA